MRQPKLLDALLLSRMQQNIGQAPFRMVLWNGVEFSFAEDPPVATVFIKDRKTLLELAINPDLYFGEAYTTGRIAVEGDLVKLLEVVYLALKASHSDGSISSRIINSKRSHDNSQQGARDNIHRHYDIGNDFYRLWLDSEMVYTCAYYPSSSATLEEAQVAKMHHVCRKLRLQPGETVVEAGCGWGALAIFMARRYGVSVRAFNISREQICYALQRAKEENVSDRVQFIEDDYRNIQGAFDAFVSVGMLEHVGLTNYPALGEVIHRSLKPNGRGLLHFIGRNCPVRVNSWINRRIFPGAYVPTLREALEVLEPWDFSILDVENLRLHYAQTLRHWRNRYEAAAERVLETFDERFVRTWRLYLAGSEAAFTTGWMQLFQVTFAGPRYEPIPWARSWLYQSPP